MSLSFILYYVPSPYPHQEYYVSLSSLVYNMLHVIFIRTRVAPAARVAPAPIKRQRIWIQRVENLVCILCIFFVNWYCFGSTL